MSSKGICRLPSSIITDDELTSAVQIAKVTSSPSKAVKLYEETHSAPAFVMICIDYRFFQDVVDSVEYEYGGKFDLFSVAGSELFVVRDGRPAFEKSFFQNLDLAIQLHHITTILCFTHADCGAYVSVYGDLPPVEEIKIHRKNVLKLKEVINFRYPSLEFRGYYLRINDTFVRLV